MTPRIPQEIDTSVASIVDTPAEQVYICQRGTGYIHSITKIVYCDQCYRNLSRPERLNWYVIFKHTLTIEGVITGINCERCHKSLTVNRLGFRCVECTEKYELYLVNPELVQVRRNFGDTVTINVYTHIQRVETLN